MKVNCRRLYKFITSCIFTSCLFEKIITFIRKAPGLPYMALSYILFKRNASVYWLIDVLTRVQATVCHHMFTSCMYE